MGFRRLELNLDEALLIEGIAKDQGTYMIRVFRNALDMYARAHYTEEQIEDMKTPYWMKDKAH